MEWEILLDEDFAEWLDCLEDGLQLEIDVFIGLLRRLGPNLHRPRVDTVKGSAFKNMKEGRIQYEGKPCAFFLRSIRSGKPSSWSAATRGTTSVGMRRASQLRMSDFGVTCGAFKKRESDHVAINYRERFAKLPKARQNKILARVEELYAEEMTLAELREARRRSQAELGEKLGIKQAAVSRIERRADMYVSTLRDVVAAMGGTLKIIAQFPDQPPVAIKQFGALDRS